ncbi:MAG: hypothetical protein OXH79_23605 [Boseongicola sp.]|nr:hypothetical protein [Boseongicola sp.]
MRNSWGFELDTSVVRLMYRDGLAWVEVAKERIEGADFEERLKAMVALVEDGAAADLLFPRSRILYADVRIDPDRATRQELERVLDGHMPHQIGELDLDWEVTVHGSVRVAAIALENLKEALDFASAHGIQVGKLTSLADPADFPRSPNFCGRGAETPLSSMIDNASTARARKIPVAGLIPVAGIGNRLLPLLDTAGHWIPQRQRTGAIFAVALAAGLGIATLLWTTLPPGLGPSEQPLEERPESELASGAPLAEPDLAAPPEGVDAAKDLLRQQPPAVHADAQQLAGPWRRGELQAPADGTGISPALLTSPLALTRPHLPTLPQAEREAPVHVDTAHGLLLQQPPVVHADAGRLSDRWRQGRHQAPSADAGAAAATLPQTLALTQPHLPRSPLAGHDAPERVDTARGLLLQQPPVVHADVQQLSDQWRRGELQAPADGTGIAAARRPTTSALARPHLPRSPQAGHDVPERVDTSHGLLLQQPPVVHADARLLSDRWRRSELQAPADDTGIAAAHRPTTLALARPHFPHAPQAGHDAPERLDTAHGLLLQKPPVVHGDSQQLSDRWLRDELQDPTDGAGFAAAPLTTALAVTRPHLAPLPQTGDAAPLVLDAQLPLDLDSLPYATADRVVPHDGQPPGAKPAIDRPAYALLETRDSPGGPVDAGPAQETSADHSPVPPELLPRMRPDGFGDYVERLKFGGRTLAELATLRALPRPASAQQLAASSAEASAATVGSGSSAPGMRPDNFDAVVAAIDAQRRLAAAAQARRAREAARNAQAALVADAEPELPDEDLTSRGTPPRSTVATRATIPNAIRLNEVNLVGVFGTTGDRRALVRLPSGRYVRVRVGDRVDGGRVARITESELFYQKGNRTVSLRVPRG